MPTAVHVQRGVRTANLQTDFLFRGRDVELTMNSVKILHAVRSAITATAELNLVMLYFTLDFLADRIYCYKI